jgi:hypothetical protein
MALNGRKPIVRFWRHCGLTKLGPAGTKCAVQAANLQAGAMPFPADAGWLVIAIAYRL